MDLFGNLCFLGVNQFEIQMAEGGQFNRVLQ